MNKELLTVIEQMQSGQVIPAIMEKEIDEDEEIIESHLSDHDRI